MTRSTVRGPVTAVVALCAALTVTACAGTDEGSNRTEVGTPPSATATPQGEEKPDGVGSADTTEGKFGVDTLKVWDRDEQMVATIAFGKLERHKLSDSAWPQPIKGHHAFRFQVTVVNKYTEPYDVQFMSFAAVAGPQGEPCEQVIDTAKGLNGQPQGPVRPGRTVKFQIGFQCPAATDIVVTGTDAFDYGTFAYVGDLPKK